MRKPWAALSVLIVLPLAVLLAVAGLAWQAQPLVSGRTEVFPADVERVLDLLRRHDPRKQAPGVMRVVVAGEADLELLLNHGARRWLPTTAARVRLEPYTASIQLSVPAPRNPFGGWFNVDARLREDEGLPALDRLRVGRVPVPGWFGEAVIQHLARRVGLNADLQLLRDVVQEVSLAPGQVAVHYTWQADTSDRVLAALVPADEQDRLRTYTAHLAALTAQLDARGPVSLAELLAPMFTLAQQRSGLVGADPTAENRAATAVLAFYVVGRRMDAVVPGARRWPRPRWLQITLNARYDSPQHFMVSAVLATEGSSPLANAIGLYKELADARGGSGFSFNDMAANRAGTRFGQLALDDPARLQSALAAGVNERDFMPDVADLPEALQEVDFVRRFGAVGSPAYRQIVAEIEARIGSTPLLR
jgi:hypothetical protein